MTIRITRKHTINGYKCLDHRCMGINENGMCKHDNKECPNIPKDGKKRAINGMPIGD